MINRETDEIDEIIKTDGMSGAERLMEGKRDRRDLKDG